MEWMRRLFGRTDTEPESDERGEEIALERDPVTGDWREMRPEGGEQT